MKKNLRAKFEEHRRELEQENHDMNTSNGHSNDSAQIGYNMAMDSFKDETKKKRLDKFYYEILNIPGTPPGLPTHDHYEEFEESEG